MIPLRPEGLKRYISEKVDYFSIFLIDFCANRPRHYELVSYYLLPVRAKRNVVVDGIAPRITDCYGNSHRCIGWHYG